MINYNHGTKINATSGWLLIDDRSSEFSIKIAHIDAVKFKRNLKKSNVKESVAEIIFTRGNENIARITFDNTEEAKSTYKYITELVYGKRKRKEELNHE